MVKLLSPLNIGCDYLHLQQIQLLGICTLCRCVNWGFKLLLLTQVVKSYLINFVSMGDTLTVHYLKSVAQLINTFFTDIDQ